MDNEVLKSFTGFEQNLYQQCAVDQSQNVIMSSFSILMALTMAMMGSRGRTEENMKQVLGFQNIHSNEILTSIRNISYSIQSDNTVKIANKIYISSKHDFNQVFKNNVVEYFNSETETMDFSYPDDAAKTINNWVELKTNNKIKDVVTAEDLREEPQLLLINAIHFKAKWKKPFSKDLTIPMNFWVSNTVSKETNFMRQTAQHKYMFSRNLNSQILIMDYENSDMSMVIILPSARDGLAEVEMKLQNIQLKNIFNIYSYHTVAVTIPKFKIEFKVDLKETLIKMGLESIFGNYADFSGMLNGFSNLKVGKVIHKAFIDVNEEHTEAAAVTYVGMIVATSARRPPPPVVFTADHPFVFYLWNRKTKTPIFSGKYLSP